MTCSTKANAKTLGRKPAVSGARDGERSTTTLDTALQRGSADEFSAMLWGPLWTHCQIAVALVYVALLALVSCLSHLSAHCGSDSSGLPADVHVDVIVVLNMRAAHQALRRLQSDESPRVRPIPCPGHGHHSFSSSISGFPEDGRDSDEVPCPTYPSSKFWEFACVKIGREEDLPQTSTDLLMRCG